MLGPSHITREPLLKYCTALTLASLLPAATATGTTAAPESSAWHQEPPFDNFGMQPLLSRRLSGLGPGVSWLDLDGDGWEDLVIGANQGGLLGGYRNLEGKSFVGWTDWNGSTPWPRATTPILPQFEADAASVSSLRFTAARMVNRLRSFRLIFKISIMGDRC